MENFWHWGLSWVVVTNGTNRTAWRRGAGRGETADHLGTVTQRLVETGRIELAGLGLPGAGANAKDQVRRAAVLLDAIHGSKALPLRSMVAGGEAPTEAADGEVRVVRKRLASRTETEQYLQAAVVFSEARKALAGALWPLSLNDSSGTGHEALVAAAAAQLSEGRLVLWLVRVHRPRSMKGMSGHADGTGHLDAAHTYYPAAALEPPSLAPPSPEPSEVADLHEAAQAATLREAARSGVPFCVPCLLKRLGLAA